MACAGHYQRYSSGGGTPQIIKDIEPYRSVITREVIGGRRQHRDHLKAHGCVEIGNEKLTPKPVYEPHGVRQDLMRAMEKKFG